MFATTSTVRFLYHHSTRLLHELAAPFFPVTFTEQEVESTKRRLDGRNTRSARIQSHDTTARLLRIARTLGLDDEKALAYIEEARQVQLSTARASGGVKLGSPMCFEDRCTVYLVTRAIRPAVAVETGVAHGVSSAYILAAMEAAACGHLHSVELRDDPGIGQVIPGDLCTRWSLHTGNSQEILPALLARHGPIDMFLHDSMHRYRFMKREYEQAWPCITPGGVLCSHDVLATNAFDRFVRRRDRDIKSSITSINFGLVLKRD